MSKKIDAALKDLKKALNKHADVVGGGAVSLKKAQRASAKVASAATAYAEAVHAKSGLGNPFDDMVQPGLEQSTLVSLAAERDKLKQSLTGPIPIPEKTAL
jgi:multidrug resistance efflux pump